MAKRMQTSDVEIIEVKDVGLKEPLVFAGFVGAGLVGTIAVDHIIDQMKMEEVAFVRSRYLPPAAIFVEEKLRHPFRIHASKKDNIYAIICEIPLREDGLYAVSSALLDWVEEKGGKEVIILEGIPVPGLPQDRKAYCVTERGRCEPFREKGIELLKKGVIVGPAGAMLSECLTRKIEGTSILTPAMANIPDPEGAAVLVEALSKTHGLKLDTSALLQGAEEIREKLKEIAESYQKAAAKKEPEKEYA